MTKVSSPFPIAADVRIEHGRRWTMLSLAVLAVLGWASGPALSQAVAPPPVPQPPPTFLHDALGLPDSVEMHGTFRPRIEGLSGQFRPAPAARNDRLVALQSTLFIGYKTGPLQFGAELFDSRIYDTRATSPVGTGETNALEPGQAFVAADLVKIFGAPGTLTAGRFTMDIGSRRLVARNQFRNTINTFSGLRYDWLGASGDSLRLFYTLPDYRLPDSAVGVRENRIELDRPSPDLQFFGGAYTRPGVLGSTMQIQSYGLIEHDSFELPTRNRNLITNALRLSRGSAPGKYDWDFEGVYQAGRARAATSVADRVDRPVSAYLFHGEVGYTLDKPWHPRLAVLYDQASGNKQGSNTIGRFDTLFGARRGDFGPTGLYGALQRANLIAPGVHIDVVPDKRWDGFFAYRALFLESATDAFAQTGVRDPTGRSGRFAGQQFEVRARYWLIPHFARLDTGAVALVKGRFLRDAPNAPTTGNTLYGYSSLILTF